MGLLIAAIGYFALSLALFVGLLLVPEPDSYADPYVVVALLALALGSFAVGVFTARWRACALAALVWVAALATDLLWAAGVIDRSDEYEPLPLAFTIVFWEPWLIPAAAALIAVGVGLRRATRQTRLPPRSGRVWPA